MTMHRKNIERKGEKTMNKPNKLELRLARLTSLLHTAADIHTLRHYERCYHRLDNSYLATHGYRYNPVRELIYQERVGR